MFDQFNLNWDEDTVRIPKLHALVEKAKSKPAPVRTIKKPRVAASPRFVPRFTKPPRIRLGQLCAVCIEDPATHHAQIDAGGPFYAICDGCAPDPNEGRPGRKPRAR